MHHESFRYNRFNSIELRKLNLRNSMELVSLFDSKISIVFIKREFII